MIKLEVEKQKLSPPKKRFIHYPKALTPNYWYMQNVYSKAWDTEANRLIDCGIPIEPINSFYASFGKHTIWIANVPYSSFTIGELTPWSIRELRPSRSTIARMIEWMHICKEQRLKDTFYSKFSQIVRKL